VSAQGYDPRLRHRLWINATLVDETWLDASAFDADAEADAVIEQYRRITAIADTRGLPWLVELYDPAEPEDQAYSRMGTDKRGMIDPWT
jgi:hypothetical protein